MAKIKLNARDMVIEVRDPATLDTETPTWVQIDGLTNFVPNPSENEETAETATFTDEGNYNQEKMQKGMVLELEGFRMADSETGEPDPGQKVCDDWHERLGPESHGELRFRHKTATTWKVWTATCTVGEGGGEINDKDAFAVTFTRCGASRTESVAAVPTP